MVRKALLVALLGALVVGGNAAAQGVQTGDLAGFVRSADDLPLPGATVSVASPALQGQRQAVTDVNGAYLLRGLAPGRYTVTFEFTDLKPVVETVAIALGGTTAMDARLDTATAVENLTVVATTPSVLSRPTGGMNLKQRDVETLPTGRTASLVAELAPGLTNNTPNVNQVTIGGAFAYDNVFMVDGVDVNDNLLARPDDLYIEEAVEETQVLTSGISAEYGRFSGGVVNLVTKRGGNDLSGSFRVNLTNGAWTDETPYERANNQTRPSIFDRYYEGTLGGALKRDRVWFFLAGRDQSSTTALTLPQTAQPFQQKDDQSRWEAKVTATPWANQTVQGQYTNRRQTSLRPSLPITIDANAADLNDTPGDLLVGGWNGVVSNRFFATGQYSQKRNHPRFGNTSTDLHDSPFLTLGRVSPGGLEYNAPYFDRNDPEDRDNRQLTGTVSYLASSPRTGTHDLKAGLEWFDAILRGGNSQSSTGYIFNADYLTSAGAPVLDADGHPVPVWTPGVTTIANSLPLRGAQMDIKTTSLFVQDRWTPLSRLTLDLGVRFERVRSEATGGLVGANTNTWVPRLGATFSLDESAQTVVNASYAHYAGRYASSNFGRNTMVANPARVTSVYNGPAGQGLDFAPGFTLSNYTVSSGSFPTANVFLEEGMSSPLTREATASIGRQFGRGVARATYVWRSTGNFIEDFIDDPSAAGKTTVVYQGTTFGVFDNQYYRNSDVAVRDYQAVMLQADRRFGANLQVAGHWTVQLTNDGNFEGEAANQPGSPSLVGNYPEILVADRVVPVGHLDDFQRHKVRLWAIYTQALGRFGSVDIAPLWRINSAMTYSLAAANVPLSAIQRSRNPGYARLPGSGTNGSQTLFFGERGSEEFAGYALVDLAVNYQVPVWQSVKPWVKIEILNVMNNQKLISWDTTIAADPNSPLDADGLPTGYLQGARFGQATSTANFARPRPGLTGGRTFFAAFGVRF